MKHIYTLLVTFFVLTFTAQAQVTIYHENFNIFTAGSAVTGSTTWEHSNVNPSTGAASGGTHVRTIPSNKLSETSFFHLNNAFSVVGFTNIQVSWIDYRTAPSGKDTNISPVKLAYSINNGQTYQEVTVSQSTAYGVWSRSSATLNIAGIYTADQLRLRWEITTPSTNKDYYAIDDITVTGTPEEGISTLDWNKIAKNEDPFATGKSYAVDGKVVTFTKSVPAGVELSARVTDSLFQSPTKTLTLIQKKATASVGSFITIKFNEPVTDLYFTLFDVDQSSGQFQDRINITAKGAMNESLTPMRNKVIRTTRNRFTAPSEVLGISSSDVSAGSPEGNVKITFGSPVVEVTLAYTNTDGTRNADGQQGIGIHNLSWRYDQPIISLPVELVSFKAQANTDGVNLTWRTASEQDNKGFEVQVSTDGKNFKNIGFVESKVGTTSLMQNYSFRDAKAASGTNYYRLKQIDFDGTSEYSKTIAVNITLTSASAVYPTLATNDVTVRLPRTDEQVIILVADMAGKQLAAVQNPSDRQVVVPVQHLQSGIYFITVITGTNKEVFRFVKR